MAITVVHYCLIRNLFEQGALPQRCAILEIGEANLYGNFPAQALAKDIHKYVTDPQRRAELLRRLAELIENPDRWMLFHLAKLVYETFFSPVEVQAVDYDGSAIAHKLDLNAPLKLSRKFDVAINHGTAEHVFNIAQVFRTMHEYTVPGGMMIHESPFSGWVDHGFFNLQPTLFVDLAQANGYELVGMYIEDFHERNAVALKSREDVYELVRHDKIPNNSSLFVVLRKGLAERSFQIPQQGYYQKSLPESGMQAWKELR